MLWQKETDDGLYIDLLKDVSYCTDKFRFNSNKNNVLSQHARKEGNQKYIRKDFKGAMDKYNESIRMANDSVTLSMGYGNRSSCFFSLQMYEQCLIDIELAKENDYPADLINKLECRKQKCLDMLKTKVKSIRDNEPDKNLPYISDAIKFEHNEEYGRSITAKRDIEIGETILIESAYVHNFFEATVNKCVNCAKKETNFIPCKNCNGVMFCSENCSKNIFHEVECDLIFGANDYIIGESLSFILRSVITGLNTFETVNELMEFVKECLNSDPNEICTSLSSYQAKYRTFFKLFSFSTEENKHHFYKIGYIIFKTIMGSKLAFKFETTATQRFLFHLIVHHVRILHTNSFGGFTEPISEWKDMMSIENTEREHQNKLHLITSYFNHSCLPNIIKLEKDNLAVCKTLLPVKKGAQLFITYIDDEVFKLDSERSDYLKRRYGFKCKCQRCSSRLSMIPEIQDSNFEYVRTYIESGNFDMNSISAIKNRCIAFLLKYPQMYSSVQGDYIISNFGAMLQKEIDLT